MRELHENTGGAISVLFLLTVWCLIASIAMIWNQIEYVTRKQHLQAAADSAAHSAEVWTSRASNAIAAQNMIIAQDAAAQTIWQAVPIADTNIKNRLNNELQRAQQLRGAGARARQRLMNALTRVYTEGGLLTDALTSIQGDIAGGKFPDPKSTQDFSKHLRQAQSAYNWVDQTYIGGSAPTAGRPGPPGPNGEGLAQLVTDWARDPTIDEKILDLIINYINTVELPIIQGPDNAAPNGRSFETRTRPATNQPVDAQVQQHEQQVFEAQQRMLDGVADAVEQTRADLAAYYKADITMATPKNDGSLGAARVTAPVKRAADIDPYVGYTDTIRTQYPHEAAAAGLVATFNIDAVNPQTADPDVGDARVWHPDVPFQVPNLPNTFTLNANVSGGWGHVWCMPLERYYNERVWNDQQTLNTTYMKYLDDSRNNRPNDPRDLLYQIRQMMGVPTNPQIKDLPGTINDDTPNEVGAIEQIYVLPTLTAPAQATSKFRTEVDIYNRHAGQYTGAVRSLRAAMLNYIGMYTYFTDSFAVSTWVSAVARARDDVIQELGLSKTFMVLATYKLRFIPEELKGGMNDSATLEIEDKLIEMNIRQVTNAILNALIAANPDNVGGGIADAVYRRQVMEAHYTPQAARQAITYIRPIAQACAVEIAREWLNRPWPYEITPPTKPVPPWRGLGKDDRQEFFTVIASAKQADGSAPRFILPKLFKKPPTLVTYAQAETLNWNEYNSSYGGSERYDQVSWIPYNRGFEGVPVPRCWRLSTRGGWAWEPRMSLADALGMSLENNPELQSYMSEAGVTGRDQKDFDVVGLH